MGNKTVISERIRPSPCETPKSSKMLQGNIIVVNLHIRIEFWHVGALVYHRGEGYFL